MFSTFIGIELQHAWRLYTLAAIDPGLRLLALRQGRLPEALSYLAEIESPLVAVNAPACLSQGRLKREENRPQLFSDLPGNHTLELRQVEYDLLLKGYPMPRTPTTQKACTAWMKRGFKLYDALRAAGFTPVTETPASHQFLETSIEAGNKCLIGVNAFPAETLHGRIQRQLILWENRLPVRDPMNFFEEVTRHKLMHSILPDQDILPLAQLNALGAAFVAYLAALHPERISRFGDPEEGVVHLPAPRPIAPQ